MGAIEDLVETDAVQTKAIKKLQDRVTALEDMKSQIDYGCSGCKDRIEAGKLRKQLAEKEKELDLLVKTFKHNHVASDNGDKCKQCGLDLRCNIHNSWAETTALADTLKGE